MKHICFITTGDIKSIATSKRALGMANPLYNNGWRVSIIMEDTEENRYRTSLECDSNINLFFFKKSSAFEEIKQKNEIIKKIKPDYLYICAFVTRNIVGVSSKAKKIVEHSELQSGIPDMKGIHKIRALFNEYSSLFYSDYILNASKYLQNCYFNRCKKLGMKNKPNFYFPYAYSSTVIQNIKIDFEKEENIKYKDKTIFVFLGTVTRNYGAFTILKAVEDLSKTSKNFKVLILGKGRHYNEALKYVEERKISDYVEMPGYIKEDDISYYFSLANSFISPMNDTIQDWARCPSKLYMYLPYNKPVITCKIGEPFEVLRDAGMYYSPGDSTELAQQMLKVINKNIPVRKCDASLHSWEYRTKEFIDWIEKQK